MAATTDGDIVQPFIDKFGVVGAIDAAPTIACSTCTHAPCDPHWCPSMSLYEPKEQT